MTSITVKLLTLLVHLFTGGYADGFVVQHGHSAAAFIPSTRGVGRSSRFLTTTYDSTEHRQQGDNPSILKDEEGTGRDDDSDATTFAVRAPLKYLGPYPSLALRFPDLATSSQRSKNVSGVSLDFVLDTAANTNTINEQVAKELQLEIVGEALPGVGAAGVIRGGETYMLGSAELEGAGLSNFTFMTGLTASALPVANPAAAGLLSLAFLQSFDGVEFDWGTAATSAATSVDETQQPQGQRPPPSVTFFVETPSNILENRISVPIQRIPITQLPSVTIRINGVDFPALLDTGSPITVLNAQAAKQAGIQTSAPDVGGDSTSNKKQQSLNPFASIASRMKQAQAASRGDVLTIMGMNGQPANLYKSSEPTSIQLPGSRRDGDEISQSSNADSVDFGPGYVFVGELPGLAALNGIGVDSPPAVVLGMDTLRRLPNMLLRAQQGEVWFPPQ